MSKTHKAPFAQTNGTNIVQVTDTSITLMAVAGEEGALLTRLTALPNGTVSKSRLKAYLSKDNGVTILPADAVTMKVYSEDITEAPTKTIFEDISQDHPIRLAKGDQLYISCDVAQTNGVTFTAEWSDF